MPLTRDLSWTKCMKRVLQLLAMPRALQALLTAVKLPTSLLTLVNLKMELRSRVLQMTLKALPAQRTIAKPLKSQLQYPTLKTRTQKRLLPSIPPIRRVLDPLVEVSLRHSLVNRRWKKQNAKDEPEATPILEKEVVESGVDGKSSPTDTTSVASSTHNSKASESSTPAIDATEDSLHRKILLISKPKSHENLVSLLVGYYHGKKMTTTSRPRVNCKVQQSQNPYLLFVKVKRPIATRFEMSYRWISRSTVDSHTLSSGRGISNE